MKTRFYSSDSATKVSFLISRAIAKSGRPISEGEFIKDCLQIFCAEAYPEKSGFAGDILLSHQKWHEELKICQEILSTH